MIRITAVLFLTLLPFCSAIFMGGARASEGEFIHHISVRGTAEKQVEPDEVIVTVEAYAEAKEAVEAQKISQQKVRQILSVADSFGIKDEDMKARYTQLSPRYEYINTKDENKRVLVGYEARTQVEIRTDKIDSYGNLIVQLTQRGIDRINNVYFDIKDRERYDADMLVKAAENAREKAEKLAKAAGASLGNVISIQESGAAAPPMPLYREKTGIMMARSADSGGGGAPALPGMQTLNASVNVTYELDD